MERPDGCTCHWEAGDSDCIVHPLDVEEQLYAHAIGAPYGGGVRCHAGAGHGPATPRGAHGDLCDACWRSLSRILDRILGRR